jgi:hypothetical protein
VDALVGDGVNEVEVVESVVLLVVVDVVNLEPVRDGSVGSFPNNVMGEA